jgi:hypothetical protein
MPSSRVGKCGHVVVAFSGQGNAPTLVKSFDINGFAMDSSDGRGHVIFDLDKGKLQKAIDYANKLAMDLIKKYGTEDENSNVSIPMYINVVTDESGEVTSRDINPKFVEFQNEFNALLQEEKEIEYKEFKLSDFDSVESDGVYVTFFKLVKPE